MKQSMKQSMKQYPCNNISKSINEDLVVTTEKESLFSDICLK